MFVHVCAWMCLETLNQMRLVAHRSDGTRFYCFLFCFISFSLCHDVKPFFKPLAAAGFTASLSVFLGEKNFHRINNVLLCSLVFLKGKGVITLTKKIHHTENTVECFINVAAIYRDQ